MGRSSGREEQRRITDEIAQAERIKTACEGQYARIQRNLDRALKILDDIHADYLARGNEERRGLNQALWEKLFVIDGMIAELTWQLHSASSPKTNSTKR